MRAGHLEITDLLWAFDTHGARVPANATAIEEMLRARGQRRAAKIVHRLPRRGADLDSDEIDALGLRVHCELSRLGEELQLGRRIAALVTALLRHLNLEAGASVRLVDVGCGLGHVLRSIAAWGQLPPSVELVGVDLNPVLVAEAERLAAAEQLAVRFVCGDAFSPGVAIDGDLPTIVVSTGLLHHLADGELGSFFAAQADLRVAAFAHYDIAPCLWSTLGACVFHRARMREPVSRHDGVLSAQRAHPAEVLLDAARAGAPGYAIEVR
jgi:SAM-dependent methyltransferase